MNIRWVRIVLGALLLEVVLFATLVPLSFVSTTLFLTAVPIGVFVFGYLVSWWVLRHVRSAPLRHGVLIGVVATAIYLGLVAVQPGGFTTAFQMYGVPLFWLVQLLRVVGCAAAGARIARPRLTHG